MSRAALVISSLLLLCASRARAWEPFRSESSAVARGNEQLAKGQAKEALEAYDEAARELPNDPGVQLDRGLALLALGKLGEAREAFRRATAGGAPKEVRAPALYDLGLAFLKEGEQAAKAEDLDGAKKLFEEAVDAFKSSLRAQPGNRDAAWNLELAKRRLSDVQQKQEEQKKEQDKKKEEEQKKDDQKDKDQNPGDQGDGGTQQPRPDAGASEQGDAGQPNQDEAQGEPDAGAPPQPEPEAQADAGEAAPPEPPQPTSPPNDRALPEHMERALDALESSEQNLEKHRARQRARTRPRRIEKDW